MHKCEKEDNYNSTLNFHQIVFGQTRLSNLIFLCNLFPCRIALYCFSLAHNYNLHIQKPTQNFWEGGPLVEVRVVYYSLQPKWTIISYILQGNQEISK